MLSRRKTLFLAGSKAASQTVLSDEEPCHFVSSIFRVKLSWMFRHDGRRLLSGCVTSGRA